MKRLSRGLFFSIALAACYCTITPASYGESLYAIGNSLTNDSYPDGVAMLAQATGVNLVVNYHIRSSASLTFIAANPSDATINRPSVWVSALPGSAYDFVALQPYRGLGAPTVASELEAIAQIVEATLAGAPRPIVFYLYEAWPNQDDTQERYHEYWEQQQVFDSTLPPLQTRQFYDRMLGELRTRFADRATFRVIPVGDVFARIDRDARAGLIAGVTDMSMLYRDRIHMGEVGRWVAATTVLTTLFKRRADASNAIGIYQFNDGQAELTPRLAMQLEDLVWSVVAADPRSGVAVDSGNQNVAQPQSGGGSLHALALIYLTSLLACRLFVCRKRYI